MLHKLVYCYYYTLLSCYACCHGQCAMVSSSSPSSGSFSILSAGFLAGFLEPIIFHPFDTFSKRLMTHSTPIRSFSQLYAVTCSRPLYDGFIFALGFKVLQRAYKFGGQPIINEMVLDKTKAESKGSKVGVAAITGALIGAGEVLLTPLDLMKIRMQTNPGNVKKGDWKQTGMFKGAGWTLIRNIPGSFCLFGGNAFTKEYFLKGRKEKSDSFLNFVYNNAISSSVGAVLSIVITSPIDVIKTRVQGANSSSSLSGIDIAKKMLKEEGLSSFSKGLIPKLLMVGPKLIFSFTVAQSLIPVLDSFFNRWS